MVSDGQYDWWETAINSGPNLTVHNYYFVLSRGDATAFYADNAHLDGGPGALTAAPPRSRRRVDIYTYAADFTTPDWAQNATIYQIFPDRFRNGDPANDQTAEDWFYPERGHAFPVKPGTRSCPTPSPKTQIQSRMVRHV